MSPQSNAITREEYGAAYEAARERTVRFLLSRGATSTLAADVAQSAWMRGWERLAQLRNPHMVVTWVNSIALNQYRREVRKERFHQYSWESDQRTSSLNLAAIDVTRALAACRPHVRALLEAQMEGISAKELALKHGLSETAVRIRFLRARRTARKALESLHENVGQLSRPRVNFRRPEPADISACD